MPALDECHDNVVRALNKDGWIVDSRPLILRIPGSRLFVDMTAKRQLNGNFEQIVVVEVKCFAKADNQTTDLYTAIGQYLIYRNLLKQHNISSQLYLAIPTHAYRGIFKDIGMEVVAESQIKLIVVDLDKEIIQEWIR